MVKKLLLASPRGFCAGVVRAVDIVKIALEVYTDPLYVRKEIIHNPHVVKELAEKGAIFVDSVEEVRRGEESSSVLTAFRPEVREKAAARSLEIIDATCPLVTKVHIEALRYAQQDYTIILIGHAGHDEVIGTMGEAPEQMRLVKAIEDIEDLEVDDPEKVAYITQTTLSLQDTKEMVEASAEEVSQHYGTPFRGHLLCHREQASGGEGSGQFVGPDPGGGCRQ